MDYREGRARARAQCMARLRFVVLSAFLAFLATALTLVCATRTYAQTVAPADCHVWRSHIDNPFDQTHYYAQPALVWDAEYAAAMVGAQLALAQLTPLSPMAAALIPSVTFGLGLHALGYAQGRYPITLHWAFTLSDRSLPIALAMPQRHRTRALITWAALATSLVCFDR